TALAEERAARLDAVGRWLDDARRNALRVVRVDLLDLDLGELARRREGDEQHAPVRQARERGATEDDLAATHGHALARGDAGGGRGVRGAHRSSLRCKNPYRDRRKRANPSCDRREW